MKYVIIHHNRHLIRHFMGDIASFLRQVQKLREHGAVGHLLIVNAATGAVIARSQLNPTVRPHVARRRRPRPRRANLR